MTAHPLDRPALSALTGRHAGLSLGQGRARRYRPGIGVFAAVEARADGAFADLAALVRAHGDVALLEPDPPPAIPGLAVAAQDLGVQMTASRLTDGPASAAAILGLGDADAPEMLALATLTEPGPFFPETHRLGSFIGIRIDGRLVAMAGERMKPDGHAEVSAVCTHPDHRGRGYAAALMRRVAATILARGETPFLHAYATNTGAIALYRSLGFTVRREVVMTRLTATEIRP